MAKNNDESLFDSISPVMVYNFLNLTEELTAKKEDTLIECPLCHYYGRCFYCIDCVRSGNFTHSKKSLERFADKKPVKYKLEEEKLLILQRYEKAILKKKNVLDVKFRIHKCKTNIDLLTKGINAFKGEIVKDGKTIEALKARKAKYVVDKEKLSERIALLKDSRRKTESSSQEVLTKLQAKRSALTKAVSCRVKELITHIFPITKVPSQHNRDASLSSDEGAYAELEEAQKTTYVQGQWVITGSPTDDVQYSVVEPCIPSTGDYSAYTAWCAEPKEVACRENMTVACAHQFDVACGISSALAYTAQMVNILSFYTDTHMPKRSAFSDFCRSQTPEKFLHNVAKLNANVLHLCLANNVDVLKLSSHRTISNLLLLLEPTEHRRRSIAAEDKGDRIESLEDSITKDLLPSADESDSESIEADYVHVSDEEDLLEVPENPPQIPASFASSMYSLWKVATGQK